MTTPKGPSKHTKAYEYVRNGHTVAHIHYKIYGGEVDGYEIYDSALKGDWVWIPAEMLTETELQKAQNLVNSHLEYLKNDNQSWPDDAA